MNSNSFGKELSSTSEHHVGVRVVEGLLPHVLQPQPKVAHCSDEVNWVAIWFHGRGEKFPRHARRAFFVLPSTRSFRVLQAATPSPTQPSSLLSCARTVMCADPSVMKNRTENRLLLAFFQASRSFEDVKHFQRVEAHCLTHFPPVTCGNRSRLCTCRCCQVLDEKKWRKSPPWLRNSHAPHKSTNWCYVRNA